MRADDLKKLIKAQPFRPIRVALSDGRCVLVRHPDQVVVSARHVYFGLATLERTPPLATPDSTDAYPRDWILVDLLHVASAEPASAA